VDADDVGVLNDGGREYQKTLWKLGWCRCAQWVRMIQRGWKSRGRGGEGKVETQKHGEVAEEK